ncbi:MAG: tRNA pseudouridine(55) synthase TruB [Rhodospirillaceae bacterium]|jgi:tRNA pseudouridine55 synthase|nr:tRNA pseudouridine(55) synthase TruB [Rhodospirillaceae bacterium]
MGRKRRGRAISGWLALDKPSGLTSTQALGKARRILDAAKAGHGGTLDPLATGILPLAFGEATKTVSFAMNMPKTYRFDVIWGTATDTDDREGKIVATSDTLPSVEAIEAKAPLFIGRIAQVPPKYSAIKVGGQRAYDLARADKDVVLEPRTVQVDRFELTRTIGPDRTEFEVDCGKGTYIRALVRDLAHALRTYGHIAELRRTRCGVFNEKSAISLDKLEALGHKAADSEVLLPVSTVLDDIPALALTEEEANRMRHGQSVSLFAVARRSPISGLTPGAAVQAVCGDRLVALATVANGLVKPVRVLNT